MRAKHKLTFSWKKGHFERKEPLTSGALTASRQEDSWSATELPSAVQYPNLPASSGLYLICTFPSFVLSSLLSPLSLPSPLSSPLPSLPHCFFYLTKRFRCEVHEVRPAP